MKNRKISPRMGSPLNTWPGARQHDGERQDEHRGCSGRLRCQGRGHASSPDGRSSLREGEQVVEQRLAASPRRTGHRQSRCRGTAGSAPRSASSSQPARCAGPWARSAVPWRAARRRIADVLEQQLAGRQQLRVHRCAPCSHAGKPGRAPSAPASWSKLEKISTPRGRIIRSKVALTGMRLGQASPAARGSAACGQFSVSGTTWTSKVWPR